MSSSSHHSDHKQTGWHLQRSISHETNTNVSEFSSLIRAGSTPPIMSEVFMWGDVKENTHWLQHQRAHPLQVSIGEGVGWHESEMTHRLDHHWGSLWCDPLHMQLERTLFPSMVRLYAYVSTIAMGCLEEERTECIDWQMRSVDLSPIEHVWDMLGGRNQVHRSVPRGIQFSRSVLLHGMGSISLWNPWTASSSAHFII